jgi:CIC family chloride channel protein
VKQKIIEFLKTVRVTSPLSKLLGLSGLVGLIAGLGAILFYWLLNVSQYFFMDFLMGYRPMGPAGEHSLIEASGTAFNPMLFFIIPALGGLLSGLIVYWIAPEAEGHGTDAAIEAFHVKRGMVRARTPFVKIIASALTIGSGGSAGREGPIAQIGAGFGSLLGQKLKLSVQDRRILMIAGMGAGIGAIFHAPLAGALFASEVLYRETEFEYEVLVPTTIASAIAYGVFNTQFGWQPLFETPGFRFDNVLQLLPYTVLAVVVAFAAKLFIKLFYYTRDKFQALRVPPHIKPMLGGLLVGAVGFFLPQSVGTGYGIIQQGLDMPDGPMTLQLLLLVASVKMFTTSFSVSSGGSGGVFGPSIVIGGALGGAVGMVFLLYFDQFGIAPGAFVVVGMAGFFSAAANTPISMVIMVSEMTGNYFLLVPAMWVNVIAFYLNRKTSLYEMQYATRIDSPAHFGNFMQEILRQIKVKDAISTPLEWSMPMVRPNTTLVELLDNLAATDSNIFPVLNDEDELIGMIDAREVRTMYKDKEMAPLVIAQDFIQNPITVTYKDSLFTAMRLQNENNVRNLIVVDDKNPKKVLDILRGSDIVSAYDKEIKRSLLDIKQN